MTSPRHKQLADTLTALAARIRDGYDPANSPDANDRAFERTGYLMIRAGLLTMHEGDRAHQLAKDWSARGYPTAVNAEPGRGTSSPDPDSDVALTSVEAGSQTSDQWERTAADLNHERALLDINAHRIEHRIANTIRVTPPDQRRTKLLADTTLDLDCANPNCDNKITGLGNDRPRRGRCRRCFTFLTNHGRDWTSRQDRHDQRETAGR